MRECDPRSQCLFNAWFYRVDFWTRMEIMRENEKNKRVVRELILNRVEKVLAEFDTVSLE